MTIRQFKINAAKQITLSPVFQKNQTSLSPLSENHLTLSPLSQTAALDVEVLLMYRLNLTKTQLLLKSNDELSDSDLHWLNDAIEKRCTGLPIAYITNHKEFYGYDFYVTPDVLIPKPDTEILVEKAILFLEEKINANPERILTVCDMCTGSGCIGISVLKSLYEDKKIPLERLPKFTLVDISQKALEVAKKNADALDSLRQKIRLVQSNLFEMLPYQFDAVLTNPPYVPSSLTDELLKDGRSEPRLALDGDITITGDKSDTDDGLEIIRNLMPQIAEHTTPQGFFLMETGEYNMKGAENLSYRAGFRGSQAFLDLEGQERVLFAHK